MNLSKHLSLFFILNFLYLGTSCAQTTMSHERKVQAIDSLSRYEISPQAVNEMARVKQISEQKSAEFSCSEQSRYDCRMQKFMHKMENKERGPVFISNGKYRVEIHFTNESNFPDKYYDKSTFKTLPIEDEEQTKKEIYEYYLGPSYESYSPEVLNINSEIAGVSILITTSQELNRFLDDSRVKGISHIANSRNIEEGYH